MLFHDIFVNFFFWGGGSSSIEQFHKINLRLNNMVFIACVKKNIKVEKINYQESEFFKKI